MNLNPLEAMLPTLERFFQLRRRVLEGSEAADAACLAGIPGGSVARMEGVADGAPFVILIVTPMTDSQKKLAEGVDFSERPA